MHAGISARLRFEKLWAKPDLVQSKTKACSLSWMHSRMSARSGNSLSFTNNFSQANNILAHTCESLFQRL